MRHSSLIAVALLAPAVIATPTRAFAAPAPAALTTPTHPAIATQAHVWGAQPVARAAWIKSCHDKKRQDTDPCGAWRLSLRDGRQVTVRAAAARGVDGKGRRAHHAGTFAVSGDGSVILYERARDHRLVVQPVAGGPPTALPRSARPAGIGSDEMAVRLSLSGDRVLIDYYDDEDRLPTKVVTAASGETVTLPPRYGVLGFSADGGEVLATRQMDDNTTTLYALGAGGDSIRSTPPQVVVNAAAWALAADGTTVAVLVQGDRARIRTYDLATGELSEGVDVPVGGGLSPSSAWWEGARLRVTYAKTADVGNSAVIRVLTVGPGHGLVTQDETYKIGKNYTFAVAGE
ncbi:hypothetical protein FXF51_50100 [Nonomuraea sp. PA05]|uniref:hypothetical protein n=1 Tax=Nonomuraea sp. PA05 TaxID=2604466 RepID=UPI0011DA58F9|nr:hypothetical protein [Nonomuraea sp. PA05]TYB52946.1 hypothetical protein FXF51_50100 [Nonomuraea sp. PA05]